MGDDKFSDDAAGVRKDGMAAGPAGTGVRAPRGGKAGAATPKAGSPDAGTAITDTPDTGAVDTGTPDTRAPETSTPDTRASSLPATGPDTDAASDTGTGAPADDADPAPADHGAEAPAAAGQTAAGLVRLSDFDPRHPGRILGELRGYWDGLRHGRAIPTRADIDPRGLRGALGHAFILERIAPGAARFRLAGRHLIDLMGMEVRGMPLCSFFNPASRGHLSDVLETVFAGPQIAELTMLSEAGYGRPALSARMLLLPLRSDLGDITRAFGALVAESEIGRPPRRFDLLGEALTPVIDGARTLDPAPGAAGFGEPPAPPWRTRDPGRSPGLGRREGRAASLPDPSARSTAAQPPAGPPPVSQPPAPPEPLPGNATAAERRARFRVIPGGN